METSTRFVFKSMPTYYRGITFRSRLEARWAIIFDEIGIAWEYEPEAFKLDLFENEFHYLPDFYLPETDCFVEVKGHLTDKEFVRLMKISAAITAPCGGRPHEYGGKPFIVVGNLGIGDFYPTPNQIWSYKGTLQLCPAPNWFIFQDLKYGLATYAWDEWWQETDGLSEIPGISKKGKDISWKCDFLCNGDPHREHFSKHEDWGKAMKKARNARFDRGNHV